MGDEFGPISTRELVAAVADKKIGPDTEVRKVGTDQWAPAMCVEGLFTAAKKAKDDAVRNAEARVEHEQLRWEKMTVSTSGPVFNRKCQVLDTIFAFDSSDGAAEAFAGVKEQLKRFAYDLGADAVVSCQFEYRVAVETDKGTEMIANLVGISAGHKQCVEIFAYGTAVRYS